uniref:Linalool synthase n=1 Tax=Lilium sp. BT-2016 TaxID=1824561 RepID=A0A144J2C9_9LILI|nr:linalool synthase [Lilium sp. BT-2016]
MDVQEERYIEGLVGEIKAELFSSSANLYSLFRASAYDTAWVAMIPNPQQPERPMFPGCLDWILSNQNPVVGSWGDLDGGLQCLADTLACVMALKIWNVGTLNIAKGLLFLGQNTEKWLNGATVDDCFVIILPGMIELIKEQGLVVFSTDGNPKVINDLFYKREGILRTMKENFFPFQLFVEALPETYKKKYVLSMLREQSGVLEFQSPSATAGAFMITGDDRCIKYLKNMVQRCGDGVPPIYPVKEDLIKLCLVDHLERLGLKEYFEDEILDATDNAYKNLAREQLYSREQDWRMQIYQESFIFRLLRLHGYRVSPRSCCWFLHNDEILAHMEGRYVHYLGSIYELYKASDLMFPEEDDLNKAKAFSAKLLHKSLSCHSSRVTYATLDNLHSEIEHDLKNPWLDRMDHLEHRRYIERNKGYTLWIGKSFSIRLFFPHNVIELAKRNFMIRQSIYKTELEELKRWSRDTGLSNMGFGREKTTYCYFLAATSICLPLKSDLRIVLAKCGILLTVADDFYDEKGSMEELYCLTKSVQRWKIEGLSNQAKVIFDALDEHVKSVTLKSLDHQGYGIKDSLQDIWRELIESWLMESTWNQNKYVPTIEQYLDVGMVSIGIQAVVFPSCFLMCPTFLDFSTNTRYNTITKTLMIIARLLNDIQSYQREVEDGKLNMVLLYLKENQEADVKDSINYIKEILKIKEKVLLEFLLIDQDIVMPREWKLIHLLFLKIFHRIYYSYNAYDSPTALLDDIKKAIYICI